MNASVSQVRERMPGRPARGVRMLDRAQSRVPRLVELPREVERAGVATERRDERIIGTGLRDLDRAPTIPDRLADVAVCRCRPHHLGHRLNVRAEPFELLGLGAVGEVQEAPAVDRATEHGRRRGGADRELRILCDRSRREPSADVDGVRRASAVACLRAARGPGRGVRNRAVRVPARPAPSR
jgi:hypothetical protein